MKNYLIKGKTVTAKNKMEALKKAGYENIYFTGNTPYSMHWGIYTKKIFAIIIK